MTNKLLISIVSGCYNEEGNLQEFYDRIIKILRGFPHYSYEIIIADNYSTDKSKEILRRIALKDKNFKVIFNSNNFGHIRSGYNALLQATGDAVILLSSDLQDPIELIPSLIKKWEEGFQVVVALGKKKYGNPLILLLKKAYYYLLSKDSKETDVIPNFYGFGLYGRKFMQALRKYNEPEPYFRNLISEIGFRRAEIEFVQPPRKCGNSKYNFFTLYDLAMLGFINQSKLLLRLPVFLAFLLGGISLFSISIIMIYKLIHWGWVLPGSILFFLIFLFAFSVQIIFIGVIGEYLSVILSQVKNKPLVIEEERINF
jgi:polyisoprenyl-phosphate glycosyltransferase